MIRVASGAVLVLVTIAAVWFAPPWLLFLIAEGLLLLALREYRDLVVALGFTAPWLAAGTLAMVCCAAVAVAPPGRGADAAIAVLMIGVVVIGTVSLFRWRGGTDALATAAIGLFPAVYLGFPIGAMLAIRERLGAPGLFLLMVTIIASDTAQYYTGRAFGRRPLAATISPKKTIEGAVGGVVVGTAVLATAGAWWLTAPLAVGLPARLALGAIVVAAGIAGDLFESLLKRSAGIKDSSSLIPGHGGILDRIDALLFAAPVYFVALSLL
jgi:phosphatidate cytidylyltransferase